MDSSFGLPPGTEASAAPHSGREPVTTCNDDDGTTDGGGVVGPPLAKKAKIENVADGTVGLPSGGDSTLSRDHGASAESDASRNSNDQGNGEHIGHLDSEELDFEEEEANSEDEELFQQILALARAGRIPLEYLAARGIHLEGFEDDEPVEYPFDQPPKSIDDVADFIKSEKCQRIMVLAG